MSDQLNPDFSVVSGDYVMTKGWRISLDDEFNRRIEDGSMVLWKPELTFWINVWNNERGASPDELLQEILVRANPERTAEKTTRGDATIHLTYELAEDDAERPDSASGSRASINGFIIAAPGYVQVSAYADTPEAHDAAWRIIDSISTC